MSTPRLGSARPEPAGGKGTASQTGANPRRQFAGGRMVSIIVPVKISSLMM
jgi:hypothetical protein